MLKSEYFFLPHLHIQLEVARVVTFCTHDARIYFPS
jgi:hypothetical protein